MIGNIILAQLKAACSSLPAIATVTLDETKEWSHGRLTGQCHVFSLLLPGDEGETIPACDNLLSIDVGTEHGFLVDIALVPNTPADTFPNCGRRLQVHALTLPPMRVKAAPATPEATFSAAVGAYRSAERAEADHAKAVDPVSMRLHAYTLAVPHKTTSATYEARIGRMGFSTFDRHHVALAESEMKQDPAEGRAEYRAVCAELIALVEARNAEIERLTSASNLGPLEAELDRLAEESNKAWQAVEAAPATTPLLLARKLEIMVDYHGHCLEGDWIGLVRDARRIAGEAA